jgi:hypothetical protein
MAARRTGDCACADLFFHALSYFHALALTNAATNMIL